MSALTLLPLSFFPPDKLERIHTEHAQELAALQEDMELPIKIASGGVVDGYLVQLINVSFSYLPSSPAAMLFQNCEFGITSKSRIVLLGENGNGVSATHSVICSRRNDWKCILCLTRMSLKCIFP
jgi:ATPase subunit of ABC transporter with duplicated ATPase domains